MCIYHFKTFTYCSLCAKSVQDECYQHVWINNCFGISGCHHQGKLSLSDLLGSICQERSTNLENIELNRKPTGKDGTFLLDTKMHTVLIIKGYVHGCSLATCNTQLGIRRLRLKSWLCPGCIEKR